MPEPIISGSLHKSLTEESKDDVAEARTRLATLLKNIKAASVESDKAVSWHRDHVLEIGLIINLLIEAEVKQAEQLEIINSEFRKRGGRGRVVGNISEKDGTNE